MARASVASLVLSLVLALARVAASQPTTVLRRDPSTGAVLANPHFETSDGVIPVVAFYYAWYGNPANDGAYRHWDHAVLPHWDPKVNARVFGADAAEALGANPSSRALGSHHPPDDIHAPFYPSRGCYSSLDPRVLDAHMREALASGVNTFAVSWWGRPDVVGTADSQGVNTDAALHLVVAAAERTWRASASDASASASAEFPGGMRVAFHLEPYPGRTAATVREDLRHILDRHGDSPALLRGARGGGPVFFVYDSYHVSPRDWSTILSPTGPDTVRGTDLDGVFLALWLTRADGAQIETGGFDGGYTYFADPATSTAADPKNWRALSDEAAARGLLFVPSVSPGYNDTRIRPWNAKTTRSRRGGRTYAANWRAALAARPAAVTITSWNEWGEGTQIEPAEVGRGGYASYRLAEDAREGEQGWRAAMRRERNGDGDDGGERGGGDGGDASAAREGEGGGDPNLYLDLTRAFARGMRRPGFDEGGAGFVRDEL